MRILVLGCDVTYSLSDANVFRTIIVISLMIHMHNSKRQQKRSTVFR